MNYHILGKRPSSQPGPEPGEGVSLAVMQFMELVRGRRPVTKPNHLYVVETVMAEEYYCFHCFRIRWWDMVRDGEGRLLVRRCRGCGKEGGT